MKDHEKIVETEKEDAEDMRAMNEFLRSSAPSGWRRFLPFLPRMMWKKELRLFTFIMWDNSYFAYPLTQKHCIDLLCPNHRKWFQPPVCGFQLWV